jgi:hypothetical protein
MRNLLLILLIITGAILSSCKKDTNDDTNPPENRNPLVFSSLIADSVAKVGAFTPLSAVATGDGLTYTWTPEYGTIIGSGPNVEWTICHSDFFTITCEVQDQYGEKQSKEVIIHAKFE